MYFNSLLLVFIPQQLTLWLCNQIFPEWILIIRFLYNVNLFLKQNNIIHIKKQL